MPSEPTLIESMFDNDALAASQSLEEELLGKGYFTETSLGSSLAAELSSATAIDSPPAMNGTSKLASMAMNRSMSSSMHTSGRSTPALATDAEKASDNDPVELDEVTRLVRETDTSPVTSPMENWPSGVSKSTSLFGPSPRSSFSSTWSSFDAEDDDPFEVLKRQLGDLNSVVWETKSLHKRLFNTLSAEESLHASRASKANGSGKATTGNVAQSVELLITSVASVLERNSRDRERQTNHLRNIDSSIRKEASLMSAETIQGLESLFASINATLHDQAYSYENPLPAMRNLNVETSSMTDTLEELKETMYVNKRQVQELNVRLRSIAKTVHEIRKDIRRTNKFLEKDDEDTVILEKGMVQERVKEIKWGLDDLDEQSSRDIKRMQLFWEQASLIPA